MQRRTLFAAGLALAFASLTAQAAETTLRAVSSFGMDTFWGERFQKFVDKVNSEGKGILQIRVIGGPEAVPPFEVGNALRTGVVDLANHTGVFHANLVPEALAMVVTDRTMGELRENGGYELLDQIHRDKANMVWLGRVTDGLPYHSYTNKPLVDNGFKGFRMRAVPMTRGFYQALGASPMQIAPGEVYTALDRSMVDGYSWPIVGVFDLGWQEKTAYRVDPGVYNVEVSLFMNQNSWKKLTDEQRSYLESQIAWMESENAKDAEINVQERQAQAEAGIETITLEGEAADAYVKTANDALWADIEKASPANAAKLKPLFMK